MSKNIKMSLTEDQTILVNVMGLNVLSKQWRNIHILGNSSAVKEAFDNSSIDISQDSINKSQQYEIFKECIKCIKCIKCKNEATYEININMLE